MARGMPKKILLASDLTPASDRAFDRAVQLASYWNAELTVLHVIEASSLRPWGIGDRLKQAGKAIEHLVQDAAGGLKQPAASHVAVGDAADRIVARAREDASDLIVIGTFNGVTLGERLLGGTAARVLRHADQPVLAVRKRTHGEYRRLAVAVDFSIQSRLAFDCALAMFPNAMFSLLHAHDATLGLQGADAIATNDHREIRAAEEDMRGFLRATDPAKRIETLVERGSPERVLPDYVDKHRPDLVIAGTHGRTGIQSALLGSVAEGLLRSVNCDVLAVRVMK